MEWVNDGAQDFLGSQNLVSVVWRPATGDAPAMVTSMYATTRTPQGRYRVTSQTTYRVGDDPDDEWVYVQEGAGSLEAYATRREANAWARRMAELEASNRRAIAWDGVPPEAGRMSA